VEDAVDPASVGDFFQVLAVPPASSHAEGDLHRTNLVMAELFVTALGIDQEVRLSGTPAWTSLCRTISFGMALDLLELCNLREMGLHGDRADPHFAADKIAALIRQVNEISNYSSRAAPVVGWPLEDLAYALADLLSPAEARIEVQASIDHVRMPPLQAHVVSTVALRLLLAILRRRHETRASGPIGLSVTKDTHEVTLIVTDHAWRKASGEDPGLRKLLLRFASSIDASFLCRTPAEHTETVAMRFSLPR
jgi:hypothetical protein